MRMAYGNCPASFPVNLQYSIEKPGGERQTLLDRQFNSAIDSYSEGLFISVGTFVGIHGGGIKSLGSPQESRDICTGICIAYCIFQNVSVCTLADRCAGRIDYRINLCIFVRKNSYDDREKTETKEINGWRK